MRYLCLARRLPGIDASRIPPLLRAEAQAVWTLYAEGIVREVHYNSEAGRGVLMLECADRAAVDTALARLPLVAEALIDFDIHPPSPFTQFAQLFAPQEWRPFEGRYPCAAFGVDPRLACSPPCPHRPRAIDAAASSPSSRPSPPAPPPISPRAPWRRGQDFLPGRILAMIDSTPALLPHVQSGALKPIFVTGPHRSSQLPDVPISTEAGVPALVLNDWEGLFVRRGMPEPIVTRQRMLDRGAEPGGGTPADLAATLRADYDRWGNAARTYNIRAG